MTSEKKFTFRRADQNDIITVQEMIQELADYEKMSDGPKQSVEDLKRDSGLTGQTEYCHIYVLDYLKNPNEKIIIGYAICYFSYSTWLGKSYFLEDIYVRPAYRGLGAGAHMFREIAAIALANQCKRVDFHVLSWNPATEFYKKFGASDLTETESWHFYRLNEKGIRQAVKTLNNI
uniref:N-acetyltransferase domain-containing protein n=1 Tax=Glossina brevipalpis TaxID=37001 RepID=A0A1A9W2C4_9MUSC